MHTHTQAQTHHYYYYCVVVVDAAAASILYYYVLLLLLEFPLVWLGVVVVACVCVYDALLADGGAHFVSETKQTICH